MNIEGLSGQEELQAIKTAQMEVHDKFKEIINLLNGMDMSTVELYIQYYQMKNIEKVIGDRIDEIKGLILEEMETNQEQKKVFDFGAFTVVPKKSYEFSESVQALEKELKAKKEEEKKSGVAITTETNYLLFK